MAGIKVSDFIRPIGTLDTYPTHLDIFGKGGIHSVNSLIDRNAINLERRNKGMFSFVQENNSFYSLLNSTSNLGWVKLFSLNEANKIDFEISCPQNYILLGDINGIAKTSPVLIDIRLDIIALKRNLDRVETLDKLDRNRIWIGNYYNEAEARINIGTINLPILSEALFPNPLSSITGDFRIPNPTFDYLSAFDWVMSGPFLPQIYATKYDTLGNPIGTDISSSLAMTQVRTAQIMKRFDNANFIVGSSTVSFNWENPKMYLIPEPLRQLYDLGTTYTFTKAQSLGALETGLLKNTVVDGAGTLSQAISGQDYVNTADITIGNLVILDPLYPLTGHKLIAPTGFSIRGNTINEFGEQTADTISVLTGIAGKFTKFAITSLIANSLIKVDEFGELKPAIANTDYTNPSEIVNILSIISAFQTAYDLFVTVTTTKDAAQDVEIVSIQAKDITQDLEIAAVEATATTAQGTASTALSTALTAEASVATLGVTVETEIAALAGVETLSILATILGFIGVAAGGKGYGDYIRGQTLNINNTWKAADLNDEGHNAVGDYEFRFPSGYSSDDRGHSTLWFDSRGRANENQAEAGLRLFSWDSGGDHIGTDDPISPLHIGLFGYQNKYHTWPFSNPTAKYKGFIFSIPDFHNESSSDDNYRFPKKFGLYDVTRTIGTWTANKYGWDSKNTIFEYDYNNFCFYKNVEHNNYVNFKETVDFQKDVNIKNNLIFTPKNSVSNIENSLFIQQITPTRKVLRYNIDGTTTQTPITKIVAGSNVTITEDLDIVTINSTQSSATTVVGTINQIKVVTSNLQNTVSLEPELILGGSQLSFANTITGTIPTLPDYTLFFHNARLKYKDVGNNINIVGRVWDIVGTPNNISVNSLDPTSPIINLVNTTVTPNTYTNIGSLTVDSTGRITNIASGTAPLTSLNLTGAVTGTNIGSTVNTILNTTQTISGNNLSFNWLTLGVYANFNHYLADSSPLASSLPLFVQSYQSGNSSNNTARAWRMFFKPGYSSTPTDANFTLSYYHNTIIEVNPLIIKNIGGSNFETTLIGGLILSGNINLNTNKLINVATPTSLTDGVNKSYADSLITNIAISSLAGYPSNSSLYLNGLGSWVNPLGSLNITTDSISSTTNKINFADIVYMNSNALHLTANTNYGILYNSSLSFTEFRGFSGFTWKTGTAGATEIMRLTSTGVDLVSNNLTTTGNLSITGTTGFVTARKIRGSSTNASITSSSDITLSAGCILTVLSGTGILPTFNYGYLNSSGTTGTATSTTAISYSIDAGSRIVASEFNARSSKNIKDIHSRDEAIEDEVLDIFKKISFTKYSYKDPYTNGFGNYYGVIAEELREVLPNYVVDNKIYLPNILCFFDIKKAKEGYYLNNNNFDLNALYSDISSVKLQLVGQKNIHIDARIEDNSFFILKENIDELDLDLFELKNIYVHGTYGDCPTVCQTRLLVFPMVLLKNVIKRLEILESKI